MMLRLPWVFIGGGLLLAGLSKVAIELTGSSNWLLGVIIGFSCLGFGLGIMVGFGLGFDASAEMCDK